jgi:two-component system sensor histidine kinase CpxA
MTRWKAIGGSLFVKIFAWFWLAMILVGAASTLVALTHVQRREDRRTERSGDQPFPDQRAVEIWETEGPDAVEDFLKGEKGPKGGRAFVFRGPLEWVSPWEPSQQVRDMAGRVLEKGERIRRVEGRRKYFAFPVLGSTGEQYVFVAEVPPRSPFRRFFRLETLGHRLAVMFLVASLVCYGLARYVTAPVKKLRRATQQLSEGDLSARVGPLLGRRRDEITDLGRDFDRMAERIEGVMGAQKRLLRDISHELRSPLARLNVALELVRQQVGSGPGPALDRIEREAERLNELIGQLLTLTVLESGAEKTERVPVDLAALVGEIATDAEFEARNRSVSVRITESEEVTAQGAPELLRRAVENVVRNGVRFTAEGSEVEIGLTCRTDEDGAWACIRVRDHGPGVPESALADLFRPFYRVAEARDRRSGGTGIGLAITERAVRLHGGTVRAANVPGGGLEVAIELPGSAA